MTNNEAAKHINIFLNGPEYENPTREEVEAMAYAVDVLAPVLNRKRIGASSRTVRLRVHTPRPPFKLINE